jgi:hypothetical protein
VTAAHALAPPQVAAKVGIAAAARRQIGHRHIVAALGCQLVAVLFALMLHVRARSVCLGWQGRVRQGRVWQAAWRVADILVGLQRAADVGIAVVEADKIFRADTAGLCCLLAALGRCQLAHLTVVAFA